MTLSCISTDFEKQMVLRCRRLIRVRKLRLAFDVLGKRLGDQVLVFGQQTIISSPIIGTVQAEVEAFYPVQQYFQGIITPRTQGIGKDPFEMGGPSLP